MDFQASASNYEEINADIFDPIYDIIDYLVRCSQVSFKNPHVNEKEIKSVDKTNYASSLFNKSPTDFLLQFGKFLRPNHLKYFEEIELHDKDTGFRHCVSQLKLYHSEESRNKRVRNRRYKALQNLKDTSDYFSEKQMMFRNPLLYEQLIGQYLTDEEIQIRDSADNENLTLLNLILETVDRNQMRETKNNQILLEDSEKTINTIKDTKQNCSSTKKYWGEFDIPETKHVVTPEPRKQSMINANERNLLREEFLQEMYSSFIEGKDIEFDYYSVDNNEDFDDLDQISQDAEDKYFDSEANDSETLEAHMASVQDFKKCSNDDDDPLDAFMEHISNKLNTVT